jgi:hypothetical protein
MLKGSGFSPIVLTALVAVNLATLDAQWQVCDCFKHCSAGGYSIDSGTRWSEMCQPCTWVLCSEGANGYYDCNDNPHNCGDSNNDRCNMWDPCC